MSAAEELFAQLPDYVTSPPIECVVFGWGVNEDGQLGYEGEERALEPRVVASLMGCKLCGRDVGRNPLVAGSRNTLVLAEDGTVRSWGWNARGTLGRAYRSDGRAAQRPIIPFKNVSIVQAAIGGWHCLAVDTHGRVYAWGGNEYMQCGLYTSCKDIATPTQVVPHVSVKQVACGGMHSLALTKDGNVWTWGEPWGDFSMSQEKTPRCVRKTHDTIMIACGAFHNMALDSNGHVFTWGINDYGQLGNGGTRYSTTPTRVVDLDDVEIVDISAGGWHSTAVSKEGDAFVWGRGEYGRLGLGDTTGSSRLRPQKVPDLEGHRVIQIAAGGTHSMCLTLDGQVFVWGRGSYGRLGTHAPTRDQYFPARLELPRGPSQWKVISIACGGRHSLCLALPLHSERMAREVSTEGSIGDDEGSEDCDVQADHVGSTRTSSLELTSAMGAEALTQHDGGNKPWGVDHEDND